jgi:chaperonin cofactor prefoldin
LKKGLETEHAKLQGLLLDKDAEIKVFIGQTFRIVAKAYKEVFPQTLRSKCECLNRGVSKLEDKCSSLSSTVDNLNTQLEKSIQNEEDLKVRVSELSRSLNATSSSSQGVQDQLTQLHRALNNAENEKKVLGSGVRITVAGKDFVLDSGRSPRSLSTAVL